jgi:hypothetical protein
VKNQAYRAVQVSRVGGAVHNAVVAPHYDPILALCAAEIGGGFINALNPSFFSVLPQVSSCFSE